MARIHCAASRGMSQAARKAAAAEQTGSGIRPMAVESTDQWRMVCCQAIIYQMNVLKDMKVKRTTMTKAENEGALKIVKGRMGCAANFCSQIAKATNKKNATTRSEIWSGESHPVVGAWL